MGQLTQFAPFLLMFVVIYFFMIRPQQKRDFKIMGQLTQFAPFLLMFVVIYFFMIRPQQKKAKNEKEFESSLKVGDKIITKSGLHGKVSELADTTVIVETMSGKLKMERSAISMEMSAAMNTAVVKK